MPGLPSNFQIIEEVKFNQTALAINTVRKPPEGPRSVHLDSSMYNVNSAAWQHVVINPWNPNNQTGLSQICALQVDTGIVSSNPCQMSIYVPDTNQLIDLPVGFCGVLPIYTAGLEFYFFMQPFIGDFSFEILNFFTPPEQIQSNKGFTKTTLVDLNGLPILTNGQRFTVDLGSVAGNTLTAAAFNGGRLSIDLGSESIGSLVTRIQPQRFVGRIDFTSNGTIAIAGAGISLNLNAVDITFINSNTTFTSMELDIQDTSGTNLFARIMNAPANGIDSIHVSGLNIPSTNGMQVVAAAMTTGTRCSGVIVAT